jgi:hypothetical protein
MALFRVLTTVSCCGSSVLPPSFSRGSRRFALFGNAAADNSRAPAAAHCYRRRYLQGLPADNEDLLDHVQNQRYQSIKSHARCKLPREKDGDTCSDERYNQLRCLRNLQDSLSGGHRLCQEHLYKGD